MSHYTPDLPTVHRENAVAKTIWCIKNFTNIHSKRLLQRYARAAWPPSASSTSTADE